MTTDYVECEGDAWPYLRRIAAAGFTHVHWCHHWNTDYLYSEAEIDRIAACLDECSLGLLDLHGSAGRKNDWSSRWPGKRQAAVELVKNRIAMTARLGADVMVMHVPRDPACGPVRKSLDELEEFCRDRNVRIAIENTNNHDAVGALLADYACDYVGLCYDSGHGNMHDDGLAFLDDLKDRLIAVHLHDNNGSADQHNLPFTGTTDWPRLAAVIAASAYAKCVSMESNMRHESPYADEAAFLADAVKAGMRLAAMIDG